MVTFRRSILFRLACDPVCRLWSGYGDLEITDEFDPSGAAYLGAGALLDFPSLKLLINGAAERLDFAITGVGGEALRLVLDDAPSVRNASVLIGEQSFGNTWQQSGQPVWLWRGLADVLAVDSGDNQGGRQRTIRLSVRSSDPYRSDPVLSTFTDQDQRRRSADDAIFDHVALISQGQHRRFGPGA